MQSVIKRFSADFLGHLLGLYQCRWEILGFVPDQCCAARTVTFRYVPERCSGQQCFVYLCLLWMSAYGASSGHLTLLIPSGFILPDSLRSMRLRSALLFGCAMCSRVIRPCHSDTRFRSLGVRTSRSPSMPPNWICTGVCLWPLPVPQKSSPRSQSQIPESSGRSKITGRASLSPTFGLWGSEFPGRMPILRVNLLSFQQVR